MKSKGYKTGMSLLAAQAFSTCICIDKYKKAKAHAVEEWTPCCHCLLTEFEFAGSDCCRSARYQRLFFLMIIISSFSVSYFFFLSVYNTFSSSSAQWSHCRMTVSSAFFAPSGGYFYFLRSRFTSTRILARADSLRFQSMVRLVWSTSVSSLVSATNSSSL